MPAKKSLRIKSHRGIEKIYEIISQVELTAWSFTEVDCFSENVKINKAETDPHISLNSWNSTHEPLIAAYYTEITPHTQGGEELILLVENMEAESKLFVNGEFAFTFSQGAKSVNVTKLL